MKPPDFDLRNPDPAQLEAMLDHLAFQLEELLANVKVHARGEASERQALDLAAAALHFNSIAAFMSFAAYTLAADVLRRRGE